MHLLSQGVPAGPMPPLAGALGALWARSGEDFVVLDAGGRAPDWGAGADPWVHLDPGFGPGRLEGLPTGAAPRFFGPAVDDPGVRDGLRSRFPAATFLLGDPEPPDVLANLANLPLTTWAGFEPPPGAFRLLAGRGPRMRPLGHLLREVVYLCETWRAGHLLFDDADLGAWPGWREDFEDELARLPWALTWEGSLSGARVRGGR